ncbi:MAG: hypothetical protein M3021_08505 [Actinomycetota bacterium]|nr:hypothetical protein [Actinomycetota bacterium]
MADMSAVREYVRRASAVVSQQETPETLQQKGIEVILAPARFTSPIPSWPERGC